MSNLKVPVGISNKHIHLSEADIITLFGEGASLTHKKDLSQIGQYAAEETVEIVGPKGSLKNIRILGPARKKTQVEIARTDSFVLGLNPPVRDSGDLSGSEPIKIIGPMGFVELTEGCILAKRHVHMNPNEAEAYGLKDRDLLKVETGGERGVVFKEVLIRVDPTYILEMHIDTDEANCALLKNGDLLSIVK